MYLTKKDVLQDDNEAEDFDAEDCIVEDIVADSPILLQVIKFKG
jgi:hypothetical protein